MTLEEAIEHCKSIACDTSDCGMEHAQLAEWLEELKQRREQEEPVSEDLKEEITRYFSTNPIKHLTDWPTLKNIALHFANWQKELFKKNIIAYCDNLTKEQVQVNSDFVADRLKKSTRTPTYIDAIEYGKKIVLAELERIVKEKEEAGKNYVFVFSEVKDLVEKMSKKG